MVESGISHWTDPWRPRAGRIFCLAVITAVACTDDSIVDNSGQALPEDRGVQLQLGNVEVAPWSPLAWSPDGTEIYFQENDSPGRLMAATLNGEVRTLDGPRDHYLDLSVAANGSALFFAADRQGGHRTTYRLPLPSGRAEVLASQASAVLPHVPADGLLALASPTANLVAYTALPDTLKLLNLLNGENRVLGRGCERVVAFAPNNTEILCQTGGGGGGAYFAIEVASGLVEPVLLVPVNTRTLFVNWNSQGLRVVYETPLGLSLWDVSSQENPVNWSIPIRPNIGLDVQNGDWSDNGNLIGIWLHECLTTQGSSLCLKGQSLLYMLEPASGRSWLTAVAHGTEGGTTMAFSRDGQYIAYVFDRKIYYKPTARP